MMATPRGRRPRRGLLLARVSDSAALVLDAQGRRRSSPRDGSSSPTRAAMAATPSAPPGRPSPRTSAGPSHRYSEATLARWLRDPAAQEPTRHMPNLQLSEAEARALAAYLASLR